jgi:hypothetical protein
MPVVSFVERLRSLSLDALVEIADTGCQADEVTRSLAERHLEQAARLAIPALNADEVEVLVEHLLLPDLAIALSLSLAFKRAARARLTRLRPIWRALIPLTAGHVSEAALLHQTLLDLSCLRIRNEGTRILTAALSIGALPALKTLRLDTNQIGDDGVGAIASACAKGALASLVELRLWSNKIGDDGAKALASACASGALASLQLLDLQANQIGDDGARAFASACDSGALASLEMLNLSGNHIGNEGVSALASACASGALASLRTLYIHANSFGAAVTQQLKAACNQRGVKIPQL